MANEDSSYYDFVSSKNGGKVLFATDDFFAVAENLIKSEEPEWRTDEYTEFGKWMDGWETRRKRKPGHDFCIIQLAKEVIIERVNVDTAFFTGNHAPAVSIQVSSQEKDFNRISVLGSEASADQISLAEISKDWETVLETSELKPGYPQTRYNNFEIYKKATAKYLRLNIFPDGGIARLRVYGKPVVKPSENLIDVASVSNGGQVSKFSNAHFGHPNNLILPSNSKGMYDGWETARQPDRPRILKMLPNGLLNHTGSEWVVLQFKCPYLIRKITIDTSHFKGNYPDSVEIKASVDEKWNWNVIVPPSKLSADCNHSFQVTSTDKYSFIKITITPDGGISRVRVYGVLDQDFN